MNAEYFTMNCEEIEFKMSVSEEAYIILLEKQITEYVK